MKNKLIAILFLLTSLTQAAQFTATYESTIGAGFGLTPQFNEGEAFIIEIVLDNGGDSMVSQTWTADDVVSIAFKMNDEPNTITSVFPGGYLTDTIGSFETDENGSLIGAPSEWNVWPMVEANATTVISTNDGNLTEDLNAQYGYFINGANNVYFVSNDNGSYENVSYVGDANVTNNTDPDYWTLAEVTNETSSSGGGCTYNPNNKGIDMMFILLLLLAAAYPLRDKLITKRN